MKNIILTCYFGHRDNQEKQNKSEEKLIEYLHKNNFTRDKLTPGTYITRTDKNIKYILLDIKNLFNESNPFLNSYSVHVYYKGVMPNRKRGLCVAILENHQFYQSYTYLPQWRLTTFENFWKYYN